MAVPKSIETRVAEIFTDKVQPTKFFQVTKFLWKTVGMHLVCKYSCYSYFDTFVFDTCNFQFFFILVTVIFFL